MIKPRREYLILSTVTDQTFTVEYYPVPDKFAALYRCPVTGTDVHFDFDNDEFEELVANNQLEIIGQV